MTYVVAQLSDTHVGGPAPGSGARLSLAVDQINAMTRQPDRVLLTGDLTHDSTAEQWAEFTRRLEPLHAPWTAIAGNHDATIEELAGHRTMLDGPVRWMLMDSAAGVFGDADADWLERELAAEPDARTVVAIHHPPFETGIWWMDCVGMRGADRLEAVVRRHPQVIQVLSGHVHRAIQSSWGSCTLWVCPSTAVAIAPDLDPEHDPAETAEPPSFSLHAYTRNGVVSHVIPVGPAGERATIESRAPEFVAQLRLEQAGHRSAFD